MSINWYLNRFKTMSFSEIIFRLKQYVQKNIEKRLNNISYKNFLLKSLPNPILKIPNIELKETSYNFRIFDKEIDIRNFNDWHLDLRSGKHFPLTFSKDIDIRTEKNGNAKYVWEINRLQFLTKLALKYRTQKNENDLALFQTIIISWINQNPFLKGVNWYSNIEVNLRLITWFLCWEIIDVTNLVSLNKKMEVFVNKYWIPSIYQHCNYSYKNPSRFSSANNHRSLPL